MATYSFNTTNAEIAFKNALRVTSLTPELSKTAALVTTSVLIDGWTPRQVAWQMFDVTKDTTSVALAAYQFYTGATPTAAGLDWLVNSPANFTDLNDGYYRRFSLENRYINFSANLGLAGEGRDFFAANYKNMTFAKAVEKAYDVIIGFQYASNAGIEPGDAINDIISRETYFKDYAAQRMPIYDPDLAAKAAMVGYIMAEAIKAEVGLYARSIENFYLDMSDGTAEHRVNLIAVYGPDSRIDDLGWG
ncbi:hypothetical protein P7B02_10480 [Caulobacter segnis]|uniref:hypothetical protein n=1 Tax=Caulobacter segnis TaxID=88688 RepID=UPI00240EC9F9|nr:hypothetical protein [Caulobacter segnis]MDG2521966.1 hypothetical protein [Caulobacter segnis]